MRTFLRGKVTLLFLMLGTLLAISGVALADQLTADGDALDANVNGTPVALGTVDPGQTFSKQIGFTLRCQGNNHVDRGKSVKLSYTATGSTIPAGGSLSGGGANTTPTDATIGPIPNTWPLDSNNSCPASPADTLTSGPDHNSNVELKAPKASGSTSFTVNYDITELNADGTVFTGDDGSNGNFTSINGNGNRSVTYTMTVRNLAPTVDSFTGPTSPTEGNTETYSVSASDPNGTTPTTTLSVVSGDATVVSGTANSASPQVKFNAPGSVKLRVTAFDGTNTVTRDLDVEVTSANTAPVVSVTGVNNNGSYEIGSPPSPGCSVVDAEDTNASATPVVDDSQLSHGLGTVTVSCSYEDAGGLDDSDTVSYTIVDTGDPTAAHQLSADANGNGWHKDDFTVTLNGSDSGGSGVKELHYTINGGTELVAAGASTVLNINTEGVKNISFSSVDWAGNDSTADSFTVRLDKTAPTSVSGSPDSAANAAGWYKSPVSFTFTGTDTLSTIDSCSTPTYSGPDGNSQTVSGSCTDKAGNESDSVASSAIKYDATAPVITNVGADSSPNAAGWYKTDVKHEFSASDNLSGFTGGVTTQSIFKTITQEGSAVTTTSGTVTDLAGNVSNSETSPGYNVDKTMPTLNPTVSPNPVVLGGLATASAGASDPGGSGIASSSCANPVNTNNIGAGQTVSCSATDLAGNTKTASATYSVAAKLDKFLQPIDGNMINEGKVGRVYPVKWQLTNTNNVLISDAAAQALIDQNLIKVQQRTMSCSTGEPTDVLETEVAAGSTVVRYDATSDQFVYNYKAPATKGCYNLEVINADGVNTRSIHFNFTK